MSHCRLAVERKAVLIYLKDYRLSVQVHVDGDEVPPTAAAHPSSGADLPSDAERLDDRAAVDVEQVMLTGTLTVEPQATHLAGQLTPMSQLIQLLVRPAPPMICSGSFPCPMK